MELCIQSGNNYLGISMKLKWKWIFIVEIQLKEVALTRHHRHMPKPPRTGNLACLICILATVKMHVQSD